jgi:hypothetical protein
MTRLLTKGCLSQEFLDPAADDATEHVLEIKMRQVLIQQAVRQAMGRGTCLECVMQKLMEFLSIPLPWHPDQPHLAEWQAFSAREILFNLDQAVEARNMAQKQVAKHKCHTKYHH